MEELFRLEWVQLSLIVVGAFALFFLVIAAIGSLISVTPERANSYASRQQEATDLKNDRWTIHPGKVQPQAQGCRASYVPLGEDMLTGERLERVAELRLVGASGRLLRLAVSPATARKVQDRGLVSVAPEFRRHIDRLRQSGSFISVDGTTGSLRIDPRDWYNELMGVPLLSPPNLIVEQSLSDSTRTSWCETELRVVTAPPANEVAFLPPEFVEEDDDDDEVTNPRIHVDAMLQEYLHNDGREDCVAELKATDEAELEQEVEDLFDDMLPSSADCPDPTETSEESFEREVQVLLAIMLKFSDGVDEKRAILMYDGISVGYPTVDYEEVKIADLEGWELEYVHQVVWDDEYEEIEYCILPFELTPGQEEELFNIN